MPTALIRVSTEQTIRKESELPTPSPSQSQLTEDTPTDSPSPHLTSRSVNLQTTITKTSLSSSHFPSSSVQPVPVIPENLSIFAAGELEIRHNISQMR